MKLENVLSFEGEAGGAGLFYACGSFGTVDHATAYVCTETGNTKTFRYDYKEISLTAVFTEYPNGVIIREDSLENHASCPIEINTLFSRFSLDGNAYEVYTQYSAWQHESQGHWQPLVTQVVAASQGIRTCDGAAPMMALHNLHSGQNTVFHLLPNAQWKMTARKFPQKLKQIVIVETGFCNDNLHLTVQAGETISLPTVFFFHAKNKTDLDAYKLHTVYNMLYPRKTLPIGFNSWLYCFDNLDIDALIAQADCAAEMGFEAFMIDAGWFGNGANWENSVGDWSENTVSGPKGRLAELSEHVRRHGMVFGLWFEPERANPQSQAVQHHPDYYMDGTLLDFANPDAVTYITEVLSTQIEKYHIGWLKLDFNATIPADPSCSAFYRYMQGQKQFIENLRNKHPHLRITNCASGGYRMELGLSTIFDSCWLSDNHGPYEGIRILKDTLKRMPTALIERWNVQKYCEGFPRYESNGPVGVMFSCNDGTWDFILNVDDSFAKQFINAGPIGFSCDLLALPAAYKASWKAHFRQLKENRAFYLQATARILVDSEDIIAIEYADPQLNRCIIQLFTKTTHAAKLIVYPVLDPHGTYRMENKSFSGELLHEEGILFDKLEDNHCYTAELFRIQ